MQGVLILACCLDTSTDFTKKKVFDIFSERSLPETVMNLATAYVSVTKPLGISVIFCIDLFSETVNTGR